MISPAMQLLQRKLEDHLNEIQQSLHGLGLTNMKLTLVGRDPNNPKIFTVTTNDDLKAVIATLDPIKQ